MIYLFEGTETFQMSLAKENLIKENGYLEENILYIDGTSSKDFSISNVMTSLNTISLFGDQRLVIVDRPYFLQASKGEGGKKGNSIAEILDKYCENPAAESDLLLYCYGFDVDKRVKEFKVLDKYKPHLVIHRLFHQLSPKELTLEIDNTLKINNINLTKEARQELNDRIDGNTTQFYKAMDKILLYGKKDLDENDITHLVSPNTDVNIWKFADSFLRGNPKQMLKNLNEMIEVERMSYTSIIPLLSHRLRVIYQVLRCDELGMSISNIEKYIGKKRVDLDLQSAGQYTSRDILKYLNDFANLDISIKSGRINEKEGFEQILLRRIKECNR